MPDTPDLRKGVDVNQTHILPREDNGRPCGCTGAWCEKEEGAITDEQFAQMGFYCQREEDERKKLEIDRARGLKKEGGRIDRDELFIEMAELWSKRSTCLRGHTAAVIVRDRRPIAVGYNGAPPGLPHCTEVGCDLVDVKAAVLAVKSNPKFQSMERHLLNEMLESSGLAEQGCQRAIHAELNAIAWASRAGIATEASTMYSLSAPCLKCAQAIISAGIIELVWKNEYRADRLDLLEEAGIVVRRWSPVEQLVDVD